MKKIISYLIFFHFFSFQAKSQLPKDEEDKLIKIVSDTLPKLNLISIKLMKENSGNKVFIDTVEFNLPHKFLLNASLFIKSGVLDDYISIRQDTFQYKIFTIKKSLIKRSLSKRKVFSNFKTYLNNAKNNDAYFSFYKLMVFKDCKLFFLAFEVKDGEIIYYSDVFILFDNDYKVMKLICYDRIQ